MSQHSSFKSELMAFFSVAQQIMMVDKTQRIVTYIDNKLVFRSELGELILYDVYLDELEEGSYNLNLFKNICELQKEDSFKLKKHTRAGYYKIGKVKVLLDKFTVMFEPLPKQQLIAKDKFATDKLKRGLAVSENFLTLNNNSSEISVIDGVLYATNRQRFLQTILVEEPVKNLSFSIPLSTFKTVSQLCNSCKEAKLSVSVYDSLVCFEVNNLQFYCFVLNKDFSKSMLTKLLNQIKDNTEEINLNLTDLATETNLLNKLHKKKNIKIQKEKTSSQVNLILENGLADSFFKQDNDDEFDFRLSPLSLVCLLSVFEFATEEEIKVEKLNQMVLVTTASTGILVAGMS